MNETSETKGLTDAVNIFVSAIAEIVEERVRTILDLSDQRIAQKLLEPALTKKQVAKHFNVHPRSVDKWMAYGQIPFYKVGKSVRFKISDIQAHWDARYGSPARATGVDRT